MHTPFAEDRAGIKPDDVAVWLYTEWVTHTLPGHMLFIDSLPVKLEKPRKPLMNGLGVRAAEP